MHDDRIKKSGRCVTGVIAVLSFGGGGGTRTPDLYSAIVALSQLSYAPAEQFGEYTQLAD